ncbi:hypothetical protein MSG28_003037 [Choristoneura fumiferana]|uniref:Uncharacterized protein n=1 Tax=Choristoneura fumiferana TaxID=7141 RepID=A0ACC0JKF4_CHOFU|nr:hypothetical protein MSG28_003037 [Choristoneura fumiferana]
MTQAREPLSIMDGNPPSCDFSTKTKRGVYISKSLAFVILVIFVLALVATSFIVYNFAACPRTDQLANVTKYELSHCDQSKLTVLPLPTENSKSVIPLEVTSAPEVTDEEEPTVQDVRLPTNVKPQKYFLKLVPYIYEGNFTFDGEISIILIVKNDTQLLTFHAVDLTFHDIKLYQKDDGRILRIVKRTEDVPRQFQILTLSETLKTGKRYVLNATYTGILNDNLHGFYRSSYDEKNVKSIARPRNMTSVSNMNSVGTEPHGTLRNYAWDHYAESLPMSTYLVAFAVTDFGKKSDKNFTVWARKEALQSASYALDIGPKILKYLEEYYKIKFPLPKIDMIALPDFKAGAMENWGLLTFREIAMLYDSGNSPTTAKARVASVVAHEIAHQWFGNLVEKTWKLMEVFVLNEVQSVFKLDALTSSHQISVEVGNPEEIGAIFDKISYGKGSAILRMMNHFLTDDVFNAGITDYLTAKMYGDAEQRDLWSALTAAARRKDAFDADVAVVMDSWTLQTGFPVLTITRDYSSGAVTFKQERFVLINNNETKESPVWWIPVSYTTASENDFNSTRPKLWLRGERSKVVRNISVGKDDWLIANIQQTGFYRINYDQRNWQMLIKILNDPSRFEKIHPINRAQIVDDAMNLALSGRLDYKTALDIINYLAHETSYVPWKAGLVALGYIDTMLSKGAYYLEYKVAANESVVRAQHRVDLLTTACHLEHGECLEQAVRIVGSASTLASIVKVVTRRLNQPHEYEELKRFVAEYCPELGRPVQQVLERTEANVQWMERNYQPIVDWLLTMDKSNNSIQYLFLDHYVNNIRNMAALKLLVLALACYCASSFPQDQPKQRNTIFGDEKLQGEIFENLKDMVAFDDTVDPALYRLPTTTKPIHYNILWGVDFTSTPQAFSGTVEIQLQATQAGVSEIVIQSEELTIGTVSLLQGTTNIPVTYELEPDFQFMRINLTTGTLNYNAQTPVVYSLTISFAAPLRNDMYGIYRSWFRNQHNDTISQFETVLPIDLFESLEAAGVEAGYYRVNYDDYTWDLITAALRGPARTQIHEYNRAQIVNDVFQFARAGIMSYTKALNILSFLEFETSYAPWVAAMTGFTWLRNRLTGTQFLVPLEDYTVAFNSAVTGNEENTQIVFSWIQNNFALVNNAFNNIATPLSYISSRLRNEAEVTNTTEMMWASQEYVIRASFTGNLQENMRGFYRSWYVDSTGNKRAFNVAEPIHLFTAFDEAAAEDGALAAYNGITIEEYFKTWSEQPGHPLLHVEINHRTGEMIVTQIVDDALQLARAGVLRYERAFNIISFLRNEDQYAPWLAAITGFNWVIRRLAHDDDNLVKLRTVINDLSIAATTRLGFAEIADESYMDGLMRMYLNTFLCNNGHAQCVTAAITNFNNWLNGVFIPANMRPWVYCTGLRLGSAANFDTFWDRYLAEDLASEKVQAWLDAERAVIGESAYNTGVAGIASTRNFLAWADVRTVELSTFFETGYIEEEIVLPELEPEPEPEPELQPEPEPAPTPSPDSANIAALSAATLLVTLAFNMMA